MEYGLIVNPVSGHKSIDEKKGLAAKIAGALHDCEIAGLDTRSKAEFRAAARELSGRVGTTVIFGGDGSAADVVNAVEPETLLGYIPMGTGNALRYALSTPKDPIKAAYRIQGAQGRPVDLVCFRDGTSQTKGFMTSLGYDAKVLIAYKKLHALRPSHFGPGMDYAKAGIETLVSYEGFTGTVRADSMDFSLGNLLQLIVNTSPYFGMGLCVMPEASLTGGKLHIRQTLKSIPRFLWSTASSRLGKNMGGAYTSAEQVSVETTSDVSLQMDGDVVSTGRKFSFGVLPEHVRFRY